MEPLLPNEKKTEVHEPRQMDAHKDEHRGDEERQESLVAAQKQAEAGGDKPHQHEVQHDPAAEGA